MLYFDLPSFESCTAYDEFKSIFSCHTTGDGVRTKNNILLAQWKHIYRLNKLGAGLSYPRYLSDAKRSVMRKIYHNGVGESRIDLGGFYYRGSSVFYTKRYATDELHGICKDGDASKIRVTIDGKPEQKARPGRVLDDAIKNFGYIEIDGARYDLASNELRLHMEEEFAMQWKAYADTEIKKTTIELRWGKSPADFRRIYDDSNYVDGVSFGSCMQGLDRHYFYVDAVQATAAWLENGSGEIVARCVIFDEVRDLTTGKTIRYAERQYATCDADKQMLVNRLIEAGMIDAYKAVGVDCHNSRNIIAANGESLYDHKFSIVCRLDHGSILSYQDTFKWYSYEDGIAYNCEMRDAPCSNLDTTSCEYYPAYDEYNDCYCTETRTARICSADDDDYRYIEISVKRYDRCTRDYKEYVFTIDSFVMTADGQEVPYCFAAYCEDIDDYLMRENAYESAHDYKWYSSKEERDRADLLYQLDLGVEYAAEGIMNNSELATKFEEVVRMFIMNN